MTVNIYDEANRLESALRQSDEYTAVKTYFEAINNNPESKQLFDEFRNIQLTLQEKQMSGQEITEEDIASANNVAAKIEQDENIAKLMQAEQRMSQIIEDLNRIIMRPLQDLYGVNEPTEQ
ncbi:YlbF family regulator [Macrococcus equipercicus]|uniref:UPF0342 protein ERX35_008190 n=1 Tax=Macrococcus equipercicus TaxID=69967 RepID=A0A9Q9F0U9_9STAP|nr:YlbF family regulator [Macrococcus equipercicus]KAA1039172.1 YlbF family regulator [Macrococcus equipercicus]UTH13348.1 YlbF family regulator [Macrococcus equipercicus]